MRPFLATVLALPGAAFAQNGHTLAVLSWRLSDVVGFIVFAALAGMVIWHLRR